MIHVFFEFLAIYQYSLLFLKCGFEILLDLEFFENSPLISMKKLKEGKVGQLVEAKLEV